MKKEHPLSAKREDFKHDKTTRSHDDLELIQESTSPWLSSPSSYIALQDAIKKKSDGLYPLEYHLIILYPLT